MKVLRSEVMGFCSGVDLAIKNALTALEQYKDKKVYSLGPLIHNTEALNDLEKRGLVIIDESKIPSLDENSVVLLRAHGVPPLVFKSIEQTGAIIIDATCPRVSVSQRRVEEYSRKGFKIIFAGDKGHGEVRAIEGSAGENFVLVGNEKEAAALDLSNPEEFSKSILLSQTTFSPREFQKIVAVLSQRIPTLQVFDTVCPATQNRQDSLVDLSKSVDAIVVIGGASSANSRRLFEISQGLCENSFFVQSADDLPQSFGDAATIGITAGASTPDFIIDEVERRIMAM